MDLNKISYHDGYVSGYEKVENNISFVIKDGWSSYPYYHRFEFLNVKIGVMNNRPELVDFVIDMFKNMNNIPVLLYSGELGKIENKEYLKLWIEYPFNMVNLYNKKSNRLILDGFEVELCDDYDDTGRLYIKFIADEIKVLEAYPVLRKYNRYQNDYLDNLSKFKKVLGNNEFRYFSSTLDNCLCTKVDFNDGNLYIYYENVFESYDKFVLKFINILCYDDISVDELVEVIKDFLVNGINASDIRLIDYKDDRFIFGILLSYEKELIINCSNIVIE